MTLNLNMRTLMMIAIALVAAAITALMARGWINAERAAIGSGGPVLQVLVAKMDVSAGHFVKVQDLRWQAWPKGTLAPVYAVQGKRKPEDFTGAVVRKGLVAGQPITDAQVVRPGEQGFLAAVLQPGMRAVSIQVNAITGISGFVFPGDSVDMVVTHTVRGRNGRDSRHVSETVLQDIRVLAVDQKTDDKNTKATIAKTVTFEVTPKQVEKIGIINKIGKISLSLRPIAREAKPKPRSAAPGLVSGAVPRTPRKVVAKPAPVPAPMPLMAASAAEMTEASATGAAPVRLIEIDAAEVKAEADARLIAAENEPEEDVPAAPKARAKPTEANILPRRERAGITMDSEVSRVLGRGMRSSAHSVRVVRGSKSEEKSY